MLEIYLYALISVFIVSLISLIGIFALSLNKNLLQMSIFVLISLGVGALFGDAIIHLFPKALEESGNAPLISFFVLFGIITFFILEKFLHWHHHTQTDTVSHYEDHEHEDAGHKHKIKPLGFLVLTSDGVHNFIDGIIIGASYIVSIELGIATTIAVILHEIPQEISDFGILIHAGFTKIKAIALNFATALFAILGTLLAFVTQTISSEMIPIITAFAAGNFIYIAGSDIIPELHKSLSLKRSFVQLTSIFIGIGLMFLLLLIE